MTPDELRTLIESDADALRLAQAGAADMCAARCRVIAPKVTRETRATELTIISLYANPMDGENVMQQIEAVAESNSLVKRMLKWMQPDSDGLDVGDTRTRDMLTLPIESGGIGLTAEQARPILAAAETEPQISGADVSTAYPFSPQE
ncbi:hypothetical protein Pla52o_35240 [Novipirellula galeiformis]|uniref:Uncharacterized protein n=1 Tax=Novipirellula galeiformis TaxID=2528004 RepID=A0A5C6CDX6_9BACT|nr:hypothetical protein [Novipirellula galeiformis]TWU22468.1 hypothetical protein Pla52o_35240 [Novipirellula galeiformis]